MYKIKYIDRILDWLKQETLIYSRPWTIILINVVLSSLMLILYEPFGFRFTGWSSLKELLGFTSITFFLSLFFFYIIPRYSNIFVAGRNWTIWNNVIYLSLFLFLTGLGVFLYDFHESSGLQLKDYFNDYFYERLFVDVSGTFAIGVVPLLIGYLIEKSYRLNENLNELSMKVTNQNDDETLSEGNDVIVINSTTKDSFSVNVQEICYVESSGNYVNIYISNSHVVRKTIRTTITNIEGLLSKYDFFCRCHRAYIINTNYIVKLGRDDKRYKLVLKGCDDEIPVSRTYISKVKALL